MSLSDLHNYIDHLETEHELSRVAVEADPALEIAAITDRVCKQPQGGRALLFEHPSGSDFSVATNLYGSVQRVCLALGVERLERLTERMSVLLDQMPAPFIDNLDRRIAELPDFAAFAPCFSGCDPALVTMEPPDLTKFPFLQSWREMGRPRAFALYHPAVGFYCRTGRG
jgi:4-hydroxy-3-polyprenylbenzoate decarboxylase